MKNLEKVIADNSYYSVKGGEFLYNKSILPVIPPPAHSVIHNKDGTRWHDKIVDYIETKGTIYPTFRRPIRVKKY